MGLFSSVYLCSVPRRNSGYPSLSLLPPSAAVDYEVDYENASQYIHINKGCGSCARARNL